MAESTHTNANVVFMNECISKGLTYEQYRQSADACGQFVYAERTYSVIGLCLTDTDEETQ